MVHNLEDRPASPGHIPSRPTDPIAAKATGTQHVSAPKPRRPRSARFLLEWQDGRSVVVHGDGVIGSDPAPPTGARVEHVIHVDGDMSLSPNHLEFGVDDEKLWVRDLGTGSGSDIEINGHPHLLQPGIFAAAPPNCIIHIGAQRIRVRMVAGRAVAGTVTIDWGVATHMGSARRQNQDEYCAATPVFAVADGMGGHAAGDLASREVVAALRGLAGRANPTPEMVLTCLADARERIGRISVRHGKPPGSTLSGVVVTGGDDGRPRWMTVNIGDSRTYRLDSSGLAQLSVDHSLAQELIFRGVASASAAPVPLSHLLTRAVLADVAHRPDIDFVPIAVGDRILVCSDGVTGQLDDPTIARVLGSIDDPLGAAKQLVDMVVDAAGPDDATALVIDASAVN
jgi:serine/threonine protein phosphatase PrpC